MKAIYMIPSYNSGSRLGKTFAQAITDARSELQKHFSSSAVLVVNCSTDKDNQKTQTIAEASQAIVIKDKTVTLGYARCVGLNYAFNQLGADFTFLGDDDLHTPPEGIPLLYQELLKGADLVFGNRSFLDMLSHPPLQLLLELGLNSICAFQSRRFIDLISGSAAFPRKGWNVLSNHFKPSDYSKLKTALPFFAAAYYSLGLKVEKATVSGRFEGSYLKDALDMKFIKHRIKTISGDYADFKRGKFLLVRIR
ncbi:glycosyltransferase [Candidatus Margulisiibacteriota bacterium]